MLWSLYPQERPSIHGRGGWWASGLVWTAQEILQPQAYDPQTVQPIVSHHNDHIILAT